MDFLKTCYISASAEGYRLHFMQVPLNDEGVKKSRAP